MKVSLENGKTSLEPSAYSTLQSRCPFRAGFGTVGDSGQGGFRGRSRSRFRVPVAGLRSVSVSGVWAVAIVGLITLLRVKEGGLAPASVILGAFKAGQAIR